MYEEMAAEGRVVTASGIVHDWSEAGYGRYLTDVEQSFATIEISAIGGEQPSGGVEEGDRLARSRSMLTTAAFIPGCDGFELRYIARPQQDGEAHIRMLITAKTRLPGEAGRELCIATAKAAVATLPSSYVGRPTAPPWMEPAQEHEAVFELRRLEEITYPQWDYIPADFYYHIADEPGDGSGWRSFWQALARVTEPVVISILFRSTGLDPVERDVLGAITSDLALIAEPHQDYNLIGLTTLYPGCENARVALESWQERVRRLQRPLLGRVAVRGSVVAAMPVATALAAAIGMATRDSSNQPMWIDTPINSEDKAAVEYAFNWLEIFPWGGSQVWQEGNAPHALRRMPYLYGVEEASAMTVLPVPDDQGVPGMARSRRITGRRAALTAAKQDVHGVRIGQFLDEGRIVHDAHLPMTAINRHVLVAGTPGSGKTTTVMTIVAQLWRYHGIPFTVIEPSKTEYRTLLAMPGMEELRIVTLGRDDVAPMRLNPLAPPPDVRCEVHANALLAVLKAALPMSPPLPQLLEESIERAYRTAGWSYDTVIENGIVPPSLRTLAACFESAFEEAGYVGEARNVASAMRVRLGSLMRGSRGRVLDTVESMDFEPLLAQPVIIEMDEVTDDADKAVMAMLLLDRIRSAAKRRGSSGGRLRHVTVVEEAHRLLARSVRPGTGEGDDARVVAVESFANAIAELRSAGEGFILSSQSPGRLVAAAVDNCSSRILHRIESAVDRGAVLADLDAGQLEREAAARLWPGEAIARWPDMEELEVLRVVPAEGVDSGRVVTTREVTERMAAHAAEVRRLLPYPLCTRDVCTSGCDTGVRSGGHNIALDIGHEAAAIWQQEAGTPAAIDPIVRLLVELSDGNPQLAYCGASHLAAHGSAFNPRRPVDIRPALQDALERAAR